MYLTKLEIKGPNYLSKYDITVFASNEEPQVGEHCLIYRRWSDPICGILVEKSRTCYRVHPGVVIPVTDVRALYKIQTVLYE